MDLKNNQAYAVGNKMRVSPRKLNLLAEAIRGLSVPKAMTFLKFSRKRVAVDVLNILKSAAANAQNNHYLDGSLLFVREAYVGKSLVLKRFHARAKGRGVRIQKPFSRLSIIVEEKKVG